MTKEEGRRELQYRQSKILLRTVEQLLKPDEVEAIWRELLSFYDPPTKSVETVSGSLTHNGLPRSIKDSDETDAATVGRKSAPTEHNCGSVARKDGDIHGND